MRLLFFCKTWDFEHNIHAKFPPAWHVILIRWVLLLLFILTQLLQSLCMLTLSFLRLGVVN